MSEDQKLLQTGPLTDAETLAVRVFLRDYGRYKWLGKLLKRWALWVTATIAAVAALKDQIISLFSKGG